MTEEKKKNEEINKDMNIKEEKDHKDKKHNKNKETEDVIRMNIDFLPLKSYTNIVECNALSIEWNNVIQNKNLNYIMGNPPFIGARQMDQGSPQKREVEKIFGKIKDVQDLDYVTCWYKKSAHFPKY